MHATSLNARLNVQGGVNALMYLYRACPSLVNQTAFILRKKAVWFTRLGLSIIKILLLLVMMFLSK